MQARRLIYFEYDCKVETRNIMIMCVSDCPRGDDEYKLLIDQGVVLALENKHFRRINCSEELYALVIDRNRRHGIIPGDSLDCLEADILDVLYSWNVQAYFHPDRWKPYPGLTIELVKEILEVADHRGYCEAQGLFDAIDGYAKAMSLDETGFAVPEFGLISFLTMKTTEGQYMREYYARKHLIEEEFSDLRAEHFNNRTG